MRNFDFSRPVIFLKNWDEQSRLSADTVVVARVSLSENELADEPRANVGGSAEGDQLHGVRCLQS